MAGTALSDPSTGSGSTTAKSRLTKHYEETLRAYHFRNQRMVIDTNAAR